MDANNFERVCTFKCVSVPRKCPKQKTGLQNNIARCHTNKLTNIWPQTNSFKALTALNGRLSLSVGWENGPERGL